MDPETARPTRASDIVGWVSATIAEIDLVPAFDVPADDYLALIRDRAEAELWVHSRDERQHEAWVALASACAEEVVRSFLRRVDSAGA